MIDKTGGHDPGDAASSGIQTRLTFGRFVYEEEDGSHWLVAPVCDVQDQDTYKARASVSIRSRQDCEDLIALLERVKQRL